MEKLNGKAMFDLRARLSQILFLGTGLLCFMGACQTPKVDFNTEIRPILNQQCLKCHSGVKRNGGLNLLFRQEALQAGDSGRPAIVPGKSDQSELMQKIRHHDPEERMPLEAPPLTEEQIALIERWIDQGAKWDTHWAYLAPQKASLPKVSKADWADNRIDPFNFTKLSGAGLEPSPMADKTQLLRRWSLDINGLPPSLEEVGAFQADQSPEAFEKQVDRLLASPHFGEKWAAMWMDLARYADTQGYEKDPHRNMWKYRDWLIQALNDDMPFDQFTIEQLAGDLLPNPTEDQVIATAFHRNSMNNTEGGTEDEEYRTAAVIDRVNTTWTVWQGTTMECVQCHGHPYDPFRQEEYYQSLAFFNNTIDADLDSEIPYWESFSPSQDSAIQLWLDQIQTEFPDQTVAASANRTSQIQQAIWPRVIPGDADDFRDVRIFGDGSLDNWAQLPKNLPDKSFFLLYKDIPMDQLTGIAVKFATGGNLGQISLHLDSLSSEEVTKISLPKKKRTEEAWVELPLHGEFSGKKDVYLKLLNQDQANSAPEGRIQLYEFRFQYADQDLPRELEDMQDSLLAIRRKAVRTPIFREKTRANQRITRRFERGNWMVPQDTVLPAVPDLFQLQADQMPNDRLAFARWLVSSDNPLSARVMVNRVWEQLFGRGLVETTEDFGTQGSPPSHPELLDDLAIRFSTEMNWSLKQLIRELVLSQTYLQDSRVSALALEVDPQNRLYSRGTRVRLSAEQVRDQALAISGLLSRKMYGPSVMPHQPDGIWQMVYSGAKWITSEGEDQYRRGLYTYWRRTSPYPSMTIFDGPSREVCVSRRISTNTPLQALTTLNDPVYVDAAAALAGRMMTEIEGDITQQLAYGYELATLRTPDPVTLEILLEVYQGGLQDFESQKSIHRVNDVSGIGAQEIAMVAVANVLLNLDQVIMKE